MLTISEIVLSAVLIVGAPIPDHTTVTNIAAHVVTTTQPLDAVHLAELSRITPDRSSFSKLARLVGHDID